MKNIVCSLLKYIFICLWFFAYSNIAKAENLIDIVNLAFKNNYEYKASIEKYNEQYAYKGLATSYLLPSIDLSGTVALQSSLRTYSSGGASSSTSTSPYGIELSLTQPLYSVEAWSAYSQSRLMAEQAQITLDNDRNSIILKSVQYYLELLSAQEDLNYIKVQKTTLDKQLQEVERKVAVGLANKLDAEEVKSSYLAVLASEISADNNLKIKVEQLNNFVNKEITNYNKVKENIKDIFIDNSSLEEWQSLSMKNNLDILNSKILVLIADEKISANKSGYYPNVALVGKYTYNHSKDSSRGQYNDNNTYLGLSLNMNLFSGGKTQNTAKQLESSKKQSEYTLKELENSVKNLTSQYYFNVFNGLSQIDALEEASTFAKSSLSATEKFYSVGSKTITDVLSANQKYFDAKRNVLKAKHDFLLSILSLKSVAGVLKNEDIVMINSYLE